MLYMTMIQGRHLSPLMLDNWMTSYEETNEI